MKLQALGILAIALTFTVSLRGESTNKFEDYKKLSAAERQKLSTNASEGLKKTYANWDGIILMGGQGWRSLQGDHFIVEKGFGEMGALFSKQTNIWDYFLTKTQNETWHSKMSKEAQHALLKPLDQENDALYKEYYKDAEWYLVKLAPTPEALALNAKAKELWVELNNRFPLGTQWKVTRKEMDDINAKVNEIRAQMRKLPQLTPEQIEAGLAKLPVDDQTDGPRR